MPAQLNMNAPKTHLRNIKIMSYLLGALVELQLSMCSYDLKIEIRNSFRYNALSTTYLV